MWSWKALSTFSEDWILLLQVTLEITKTGRSQMNQTLFHFLFSAVVSVLGSVSYVFSFSGFLCLVVLPVLYISIMMSFLYTAVGEHGCMFFLNLCRKGLALMWDDFGSTLMFEIHVGGSPVLWASVWKCGAEQEERATGFHAFFCRRDFVHLQLLSVSSWNLCDPVLSCGKAGMGREATYLWSKQSNATSEQERQPHPCSFGWALSVRGTYWEGPICMVFFGDQESSRHWTECVICSSGMS